MTGHQEIRDERAMMLTEEMLQQPTFEELNKLATPPVAYQQKRQKLSHNENSHEKGQEPIINSAFTTLPKKVSVPVADEEKIDVTASSFRIPRKKRQQANENSDSVAKKPRGI